MKRKTQEQIRVGIIMGSASDWPTLRAAAEVCREFGVVCETRVVSAHRTPLDMVEYARSAAERGLRVIIAGAGGAAHLPGMVASLTPLPVIGVPVESKALKGLDSLLSIVQMPGGIPVATVAIGGARNAGLLAVQILGAADMRLRRRVEAFRARLADEARASQAKLSEYSIPVSAPRALPDMEGRAPARPRSSSGTRSSLHMRGGAEAPPSTPGQRSENKS